MCKHIPNEQQCNRHFHQHELRINKTSATLIRGQFVAHTCTVHYFKLPPTEKFTPPLGLLRLPNQVAPSKVASSKAGRSFAEL
jgi:hypothetical protein